MKSFLLSIDQGTTGSTALIISPEGEILAKATEEFSQYFPNPGWVEHDLEEIWQSVQKAIVRAFELAKVEANGCLSIGITNQRETVVVWDRKTGVPIHRAIVWQDKRTTEMCFSLRERGDESWVRDRTGLLFDPYFSATKISWILDHVRSARAQAERGELIFGTIDSWLVYRLSGGKVHITDVSNASRTLLLDIQKVNWDDDLCQLFQVPKNMLPEVRSSSEIYGTTKNVPSLPDGIPVAGIAGDQQAALFGQNCFSVGDVKCTYGTGAFILMNTGDQPVASKHGLLTTIAWRIKDQTVYALEGSAFVAGAAIQWLRDGLGIIRTSDEVETFARQVDSSGDVVFVPALAGLGAPYWDPEARGLICGISRHTTAAHICRAAIEGIAFQVADLTWAMERDVGQRLRRLRVDGGAASNNLMMQFQSDILNVSTERPLCLETTALGAAYLSGLAVGVFKDLESITKKHKIEKTFESNMDIAERERHIARWKLAVSRAESNLRKI